jgi:hypothetical protein
MQTVNRAQNRSTKSCSDTPNIIFSEYEELLKLPIDLSKAN